MINLKENNLIKRYRVVFYNPVSSFQVINEKGKIVYEREEKQPYKTWDFNLNKKGVYRIVNTKPSLTKIISIKEIPFKKWKEIPIPSVKSWDFYKNNNGKKIIYEYRPNWRSPMSIIPASNPLKIVYNSHFLTLPEYKKDFIFAHEIGHTHYKGEYACDIFALNRVMRNGGNLSTCLKALRETLRKDPVNEDRINYFIKKYNESILLNDKIKENE